MRNRTKYLPLCDSHPELAKEWADDREISTISPGSSYKARWECSEGHSYLAVVQARTKGSGCPYCSGRKPIPGFNDLLTTHPEIAEEWVDKKRPVDTVSIGSIYKGEWKCDQGHIYSASPNNRAKGKGCPYCSGRKPIPGVNDLLTTHPEIAEEWADERAVHSVSAGSGYKATWRCPEGHLYSATVDSRTKRKAGCVYCSSTFKKILPGFNDLQTKYPEISKEWDLHKNSDMPSDVLPTVKDKRWWLCENNHSYYSSIGGRVNERGCRECSSALSISKAEQEIFDYLKSILPESSPLRQSDRSAISPYELDIYAPKQKVAIEFNGVYWHSERNGKMKEYHQKKFTLCREKGIRLLTIWEDDWNKNKEIIKNMISHKLGISAQGKVFARDTVFEKISTKEGVEFLGEHHLKGGNKSSKHYGLRRKSDKKLVSVMSVRFTKSKKDLEIKRFATNASVPGGFSKLLKGAIREHKQDNPFDFAERVVSYSQNDYSWGEVYEKNGFIKVHDGTPGYFYVVNSNREHRLNYSPKRFRERDDLIFEEGKTERELAELNGLFRIWDCGSALWSKEI